MGTNKKKMTQERLDRLRDAYNAWQPYAPDSPSADELAAQHGISKQTMYAWRRKDWKMDGRDVMKGREKAADSGLADVVAYLVEQVTAVKVENERLRAQLEEAVRERGRAGETDRADHSAGAVSR